MAVRNYLVDAFYSLGANVNKRSGASNEETQEGVIGTMIPELDLDMDEAEMVTLSDTWEKVWKDSDVKSKWESRGEENEKYWKGEHYDRPDVDKTRAVMDNAIFEGLETYLPQATRRNPEAMVALKVGVEQTQPNQDFAHALQLELGELADELKIRLKLKGVARHWSIRLLGATKVSWDVKNNRPWVKVIRPQKLILDPEATVDEDGYTGGRIGEHRQLSAQELTDLIKEEKGAEGEKGSIALIKAKAQDNMATMIGFIEWWTPDYFFWKMDKTILKKRKNPHWNYDEQPKAPKPEGATDEMPQGAPTLQLPQPPAGGPALPQLPQGQPMANAPAPEPTKGINHLMTRSMPYILLSIYNLGKQPVDQTSNIGQNLANQDLINKRIKQIDRNADSMNEGMVVSLERSGLTAQQAKGVTSALRKGGVVAIPAGAPTDAVWKPPTAGLPPDVYNQLVDVRTRVKDIWGTRGISSGGVAKESTVRGKYQLQQLDTDRIGGGITEYLEQHADDLYNWLVQLLYVYDDRFVDAFARGIIPPKVKISVKEGSLLPKDSTTIANQAISLSEAGKMSILDLYKRLDYPNPEEMAANVWLEVNAPELLFKDPRVAQVIQQRQQAAQAAAGGEKKPPSQSINFKDLPPEGQAQMAKEVGIDLHPEALAAHAEFKDASAAAKSAPAMPETGAQGP